MKIKGTLKKILDAEEYRTAVELSRSSGVSDYDLVDAFCHKLIAVGETNEE